MQASKSYVLFMRLICHLAALFFGTGAVLFGVANPDPAKFNLVAWWGMTAGLVLLMLMLIYISTLLTKELRQRD